MKQITLFSAAPESPLRLILDGASEHLESYSLDSDPSEDLCGDTDLFVLDCGFHPQKGLTLLSKIKSSFPHTPVIFMTDESSEELAVRAFRAGARDYFKKPVDICALRNTIRRVYKIARTQQEERRPITGQADACGCPPTAATTGVPIALLRAVRYIDMSTGGRIRLDDIAHDACLSKYHFCRIFKSHLGMSVQQYVLQARIEKAKQILLVNRGMRITTIAEAVGFSSPARFSSCFKKITGTSPTAFRRIPECRDGIQPKS